MKYLWTAITIAVLALIPMSVSADVTVPVAVSVPEMSGLDVGIYQVDAGTDEWNTESRSNVNFGMLRWDSVNKIFTANRYHAIEVGINDNSPTWRVHYSASDLTDGVDFLNENINLSFVRATYTSPTTRPDEYILEKATWLDAKGGKSFPKDILRDGTKQGWLRIYCGVATGNEATDAPGAKPITIGHNPGRYAGTITLSLTQ